MTGMGEAGFLEVDNVLEVFVGGDAGIQWGASLKYSKDENEVAITPDTQESSTLGLNVGAIMGNMEAYARLNIKEEAEGGNAAADKFERDFNPTIGFAYSMKNNSFFVEYEKDGAEYTNATAAANTYESSRFTLGWGKTHKVSDSARVYTDVSFNSTSAEYTDGTTAGNSAEGKRTTLPVTVAMEADANSWLTLRGSVTYNVIGNNENDITNLSGTSANNDKKITIANSTTVAAGATLNFGKLKVDGVIGTEGGANNDGILSLDQVMSRVAVHYWF